MSKIRLVLSSCPDLDSAEIGNLRLKSICSLCKYNSDCLLDVFMEGEFIKDREYLLLAKSTEERLRTWNPFGKPTILMRFQNFCYGRCQIEQRGMENGSKNVA